MFKSRKSIIKASIKNTLNQVKGKGLDIVYNTFCGEYYVEPFNLTIWYFFKTNEDWKNAEDSGFADEIRQLTKINMLKKGYPVSAFEINIVPLGFEKHMEQYIFANHTEEQKQEHIKELTRRKVSIKFASEEDVEKKANGNYYRYFK